MPLRFAASADRSSSARRWPGDDAVSRAVSREHDRTPDKGTLALDDDPPRDVGDVELALEGPLAPTERSVASQEKKAKRAGSARVVVVEEVAALGQEQVPVRADAQGRARGRRGARGEEEERARDGARPRGRRREPRAQGPHERREPRRQPGRVVVVGGGGQGSGRRRLAELDAAVAAVPGDRDRLVLGDRVLDGDLGAVLGVLLGGGAPEAWRELVAVRLDAALVQGQARREERDLDREDADDRERRRDCGRRVGTVVKGNGPGTRCRSSSRPAGRSRSRRGTWAGKG